MEKKKKLKKKKEEGDAREEEERRPRGGGRGEGRAQKKRERDAEEEEETSRVASSLVVHSPPRGVSRPPHFKGAETREKERKKEKERVSTGTKLKKIIGQKFQTSTLTQKKERGEREEPSSSLEVRVALRVRTPRRAKDGERRREENVVVVFPVEETVR